MEWAVWRIAQWPIAPAFSLKTATSGSIWKTDGPSVLIVFFVLSFFRVFVIQFNFFAGGKRDIAQARRGENRRREIHESVMKGSDTLRFSKTAWRSWKANEIWDGPISVPPRNCATEKN